jgi:uncharacterized glyoxalase superfamily protein PhnB
MPSSLRPTPPGWPRISNSAFYEDPRAAIEFLCRAFGFEVRMLVEGEAGEIVHSELTFGDGLLIVNGIKPTNAHHASPKSVGMHNTQQMCIFVDDVDAHSAHAKSMGAIVTTEPKTSDYGDDYWTDRSYEACDPEGHRWWFMQRLRTGRNAV